MEKQKCVNVIYGPPDNKKSGLAELNGVLESEPLTPKLARVAARIVIGADYGCTVTDTDYGYRLYENTARKIKL